MEILKQIQADTYIKFRSKNIRKKTNNQQKICSVIQKFIDEFKEGKITRTEYVKKVSFKFKPQVF